MKLYAWDPTKNAELKERRGISFEEIVLHIELGNEVDLFDHPNQECYPGQKISVVIVEDYAYLIPFVESSAEIFLKTNIPTRKATRDYVRKSDEQT